MCPLIKYYETQMKRVTARKIDDKTKQSVYKVQSESLKQLLTYYANATEAAAILGVSEMTLRNWAYCTRPRIMSPQLAIHIEAVTANHHRERRFRREDFRPDLFVKGWKPA